VLFTGAQHGELTENTSLCGIANGNASEYLLRSIFVYKRLKLRLSISS
jgi:hypothetical protein